jgi:cellulose biosynthesis protein BcsQ
LPDPKPADVANLLSEVKLDLEAYKVFRNVRVGPPGVRNESVGDATTVSDISNPRPEKSGQFSLDHPPRLPVPLKQPGHFAGPGHWSGLNSVLRPYRSNVAESPLRGTAASELSWTSLTSVCGGVGATTIAASLARIASMDGKDVVLIDTAQDSIMTLHFGGRVMQAEMLTFVPRPARGASGTRAIHVCHNADPLSDAQLESWVRACAESLNVYDGHLIIDSDLGGRSLQLAEDFGHGVNVLVLVPDVRCLVALQRGIDLSVATTESRRVARPRLLLNQFDASEPLHCEVRDRMSKHYQDLLIPLAIRRDRNIPAAVAEGMTVVEYAPDSAAAEDLYRLSEWLGSFRLDLPGICFSATRPAV